MSTYCLFSGIVGLQKSILKFFDNYKRKSYNTTCRILYAHSLSRYSVSRESDSKYLVYALRGGGLMGILAYETFIGWNVLSPGARAMGSVTLLLQILNHLLPLGLSLPTIPRCTRWPTTGQMKKLYTHIYIYNIKCNIAVSRAKCHVGIKSKFVFLARRGRSHLYIYILCILLCIVKAGPSSIIVRPKQTP